MGAAHAPFPAICGYLLGVRTGEGSVSVTRLPSGRWRAQVYDPATGKEPQRLEGRWRPWHVRD
jgi:hypothetical protein